MKAKFYNFICATVLSLCLVSGANAQYFKFDQSQGQAYETQQDVEVAVDGILKFFGAVVGGGLYHTADLHSVGGVDIGFRGVVASVPDEFEAVPVFLDENRVGLAFLHGSVGLPGNLEVMGRFFYQPLGADQNTVLTPPRAADSRGGVTLIGAGLKYGLLQMPGAPKVTLIGAYHALFVPEEFDFGTVGTASLKAVASYSLPFLPIAGVYASVGVDHTRLSLDEDIDLFTDALGGESFSTTETSYGIGATVRPFPLIIVNGALGFGEFNSFDLGFAISFR